MPSHVHLTIPQPCAESWAAMTPTATGRHCAACQKTVVDFSLKTDAEILAYLAQAAGTTCGQFRAGQLDRPLLPAELVVPATSRWRTWLAAAVAVWSLREGSGVAAAAQVSAAQHSRHPGQKPAPHPAAMPVPLVRGVVRDPATNEPLPGVAVFLKGENRRTVTDSAGRFRLRVPAHGAQAHHALVLHRFGYQSRTVPVPGNARLAGRMTIELQSDLTAEGVQITGNMPERRYQTMTLGGAVSMLVVEEVKPPTKVKVRSHRTFFKWLTQPFHRNQTSH